MKPLTDLITENLIEGLASRSNLRYGKAIVKNGEFKIEKTNIFNLIAKVKNKGSGEHTAELMSTTKGFRWKCSCSNRKNNFCEHCIALALTHIQQNSNLSN